MDQMNREGKDCAWNGFELSQSDNLEGADDTPQVDISLD